MIALMAAHGIMLMHAATALYIRVYSLKVREHDVLGSPENFIKAAEFM